MLFGSCGDFSVTNFGLACFHTYEQVDKFVVKSVLFNQLNFSL